MSLSKNINPSLVLVQPRKTGPFITERLLMGRKESNQTNKQTNKFFVEYSSVINPFGQIDSSFWFDTINLEVPRDGLLYISRGIRL